MSNLLDICLGEIDVAIERGDKECLFYAPEAIDDGDLLLALAEHGFEVSLMHGYVRVKW